MNLVKRASLYIFYVLLAYMPFHIFISTWLGTSFGILDAAKIAKDILLIAGAVLAFAASVRQPWFRKLLKDQLVQLILAYAALTVVMALFKPTDKDAELLGVVYNTRFLLFFLYGVLLTRLFEAQHVLKRAVQIVLAAGLLVLLFGVIQYTLLSNTALSHVGYVRSNGVLPAFFIDDKPDLERVMSTLRDPNSLGSYIIIIGSLAMAGLMRLKNKNVKRMAASLLALSLLCLWLTFSRSALIGFVLAAGVLVAACIHKKGSPKINKKWLMFAGVLFVLLVGGVYSLKNTYFVQNVVFHADKATVLEDPNELRVRFLQESVKNIAANPIGSGPGTAGLASIRNNVQGTVLNENYYLQIATEVGIIGLGLFIAVLGICAQRLWKLRSSTIAVGLLASFVGLAFTNLLVHIWSNEAAAYTWWGLAGLAVFSVRPKTRKPL